MSNRQREAGLLHNKDFILLFLGGFVSRIGDGIHYIGLVWLVLELTGSGTTTGILLLTATLPGVLCGPFAGVLADRISRKFLIVSMDFFRGIITLYLSWIVYSSQVEFIHLVIITAIIAISSSFFNPAVSATFPNLVAKSDLQRAISLDQFNISVANIIGAALGGVLIALLGIAGVFLVNGLSFVISGISELFINIPKTERDERNKGTMLTDLKDGANYIISHQDIFYLFIIAIFINLLISGTLMIGLPFTFKEILRVDSDLFGIAQSLFPAGVLVGALFLSFYREIRNYYLVLISTFTMASFFVIGLGLPLVPLSLQLFNTGQIYWTLVTIIFLFGINSAVLNVPIKVVLQRLIPDHIRGRAFGLLDTLSQSMVPISVALVGFLLDVVPTYTIFVTSGILSLGLTIYSTRIPALKGLGRKEG